jgi:transcriptional repressor NrdR
VRCPFCASADTHVLETREAADSLRRRRSCGECGQRFTTYERVEALALAVRKRDGRRETFDREKLLRGLVRAAAKRPLTVDQLEQLVEVVAAELAAAGGELPADRIGELVLRELRALDGVAYVRFASVYRNFEDAGEFAAELKRLEVGGRRRSASAGRGKKGSVRSAADDLESTLITPRDTANSLQIAVEGEESVHGE